MRWKRTLTNTYTHSWTKGIKWLNNLWEQAHRLQFGQQLHLCKYEFSWSEHHDSPSPTWFVWFQIYFPSALSSRIRRHMLYSLSEWARKLLTVNYSIMRRSTNTWPISIQLTHEYNADGTRTSSNVRINLRNWTHLSGRIDST